MTLLCILIGLLILIPLSLYAEIFVGCLVALGALSALLGIAYTTGYWIIELIRRI